MLAVVDVKLAVSLPDSASSNALERVRDIVFDIEQVVRPEGEIVVHDVRLVGGP